MGSLWECYRSAIALSECYLLSESECYRSAIGVLSRSAIGVLSECYRAHYSFA